MTSIGEVVFYSLIGAAYVAFAILAPGIFSGNPKATVLNLDKLPTPGGSAERDGVPVRHSAAALAANTSWKGTPASSSLSFAASSSTSTSGVAQGQGQGAVSMSQSGPRHSLLPAEEGTLQTKRSKEDLQSWRRSRKKKRKKREKSRPESGESPGPEVAHGPPTGERNFFCGFSGRALPVLFAGIQKSGSSTLFEDLWSSLSFRMDLPCITKKEKYWWGCKEPHLLAFGGVAKPPFASVWGKCDVPRRGVLADFTPENFYYPYVPYRLRKIYGRFGSKELVFLMGFRAPLSRMLAAFSGGIHSGWIYHHTRPNLTFAEHVTEFMAEWDKRGRAKWLPTLWRTNDYRTVDQGLYYFKLRHFLGAGFRPSQFIIYPAKLYMEHRQNLDENPILQAVRSKLGNRTLRPKELINASEITNRGHHSTIEQELPEKRLRHRLREEVFAPANRRLMELLAEKSQEGMVLVGYNGKPGDVNAVTEWMTSKWEV